MKNFDLYLIFIFLLSYTSCEERHKIINAEGTILELDVSNVLEEKEKDVYVSQLAQKIHYIPLETKDSCLLISVNNIYLAQNSIFVSDSKKLLKFDKSGKFIKQIGAFGRGPGEYDSLIKFAINEFLKEIYILSHMTRIMLVYDLETGAFKRNFKINIDVSKFDVFPHGNIAFLTNDLPVGTGLHSIDEVQVTDNEGMIIATGQNDERNNNRSTTIGYANLYKIKNDEFRYIYNFGDTLYSITKDYIRKPHIVFNLNNKIKREKLMIDPFSDEIQFLDFISIPRILENNNYIFITFQKGIGIGKWHFINVIYDKNSEDLIPVSNFINDIDGGISFWPRHSFGNILITSYEAIQIIDYYHSTLGIISHSEEFTSMVNKLKISDNPVLVFLEN